MAGSDKFVPLTSELYRYVLAHGDNGDPIRRALAEETQKLGMISMMQIADEQGTLLQMLVSVIGARSAVEVGTFTGYSALCVARGLPPDGRLLCCDVNQEWTAIARRYWDKAGVASKITLKLAPAAETLSALPASPSFDFAFIDADKTNYKVYYEEILKRMRPNGLIAVDNVLWGGNVVKDSDTRDDTKAIRAFNDYVAADARVDKVMVAIADGLLICRKR